MDWAWSVRYLRRESTAAVAGAMFVACCALAGIIGLLRLVLGPNRTVTLLRLAILSILIYVLIRFASYPVASLMSPMLLRWSLMLVSVTIAFALVNRLSDHNWPSLLRATAFAAVGFCLTPAIWRAVVLSEQNWTPLASSQLADGLSAPTVVLILDELGFNAAGPVSDALQEEGLNWKVIAVPPAGKSTINAIPAMFTGLNFDQASPCGVTSICSGPAVLDFGKLRSTRSDIDIVGLYHPYCAIRNLRHCTTFNLPQGHEWLLSSLANEYVRRIGLPLPDQWLGSRAGANQKLRNVVDEQTAAVFSAPFWTRGGFLLAHLALPHPPGLVPLDSLEAEYKHNVLAAAAVVRLIVQRLRREFGDQFHVVITSDHPLRSDWCDYPYYAGVSCDASITEPTVPVIVASPLPVRTPTIRSASEILTVM